MIEHLVYDVFDHHVSYRTGWTLISTPFPKMTQKFSCQAENIIGKATKSFIVNSWNAPSFNNPNKEQIDIMSGDDLEIYCNVQGNPRPKLAWFFNDQHLLGQFDNVLEIKNISNNNQGEYTCKAENIGGSAEKSYELRINIPPIVDIPGIKNGNLTLTTGQHLVQPCNLVQGYPLPKVYWSHAGKNDGDILNITSVSIDDIGIYTCIGESVVGKHLDSFYLSVQEKPIILKQQLDTKIVLNQGDELHLECPTKGHPKPIISWLKNSLLELNSDVILQSNSQSDGKFIIEQVNQFDAGEYTCRAENNAGFTQLKFDVDVLIEPDIIPVEDTSFIETQGKEISFECSHIASANPKPKITWMKDGKEIVAIPGKIYFFITVNGKKITLKNLQLSDRGRYDCLVENSIGEEILAYNLEVYILPEISPFPASSNVTLIDGEPASFSCSITAGYPTPSIRWYLNENLLDHVDEVIEIFSVNLAVMEPGCENLTTGLPGRTRLIFA